MKITRALLFLQLFTFCCFSQTNRVYVTMTFQIATNGAFYLETRDQAMESKESWSAELYPAGNWGPVMDGLQLSLRLTTNQFAVGNSVDAIVILRNVGTTLVQYNEVARGRKNDTFHFVVTTTNGVVANRPESDIIHGRIMQLPPSTQSKYHKNLAADFNLTKPATYQVYAKFYHADSLTKARLEIVSGETSFEIVAPSPANGGATNP
jgi:hypothetical protein